jgi:4a-hydroxytetrahydrobiopterin dehydratase
MDSNLSQEKCIPCSVGTPVLEGKELEALMEEIEDDWELIEDKKIARKFKFDNFAKALEFVNKVGSIAEEKGHHPDIELGWGRAKIIFTTHKIDGLSRNDFIMASLVDEINN